MMTYKILKMYVIALIFVKHGKLYYVTLAFLIVLPTFFLN